MTLLLGDLGSGITTGSNGSILLIKSVRPNRPNIDR